MKNQALFSSKDKSKSKSKKLKCCLLQFFLALKGLKSKILKVKYCTAMFFLSFLSALRLTECKT